jgi:hypothetical protein
MAWSDAFWKPIKLKDGRALATLSDARNLLSALSPVDQSAEHWQNAEETLARAAFAPSARDEALSAMVRALKANGLL